MTTRITVIGTGRIGTMHADMLANRVDGAELAGVYDAFPEASAAVATLHGVPAAASIEEAIGFDADAVAICTPTPSHVDIIEAAAAAGRAVFCEKPLSLDIAEVDRALAAVAAADVPLQLGFNRRFDPAHAAVGAAVRDGHVGEPHLCTITSRDPAPPPIGYIESSGGIFNDMTIHDFDMARFVTRSDIVEVMAKGAVRIDPAIGEAGDVDTATLLLTHKNGALTTINNSRQAVYGYDQRVEVFGSAGMSQSHNVHRSPSVLATAQGYHEPPLEDFFLERYAQSYLDQWAAFVDAVATGSPPPVDGIDGRAALIAGLAANRSLSTGLPVLCSEIEEEN